jgi:hypothetical protein
MKAESRSFALSILLFFSRFGDDAILVESFQPVSSYHNFHKLSQNNYQCRPSYCRRCNNVHFDSSALFNTKENDEQESNKSKILQDQDPEHPLAPIVSSLSSLIPDESQPVESKENDPEVSIFIISLF